MHVALLHDGSQFQLSKQVIIGSYDGFAVQKQEGGSFPLDTLDQHSPERHHSGRKKKNPELATDLGII